MSNDYTKLRELLANETYPHRYIHKFIGLKSDVFVQAVLLLEKKHPNAKRVSERESVSSSGQQLYIAYTFEFLAQTPEDVIALMQATTQLPDLKIIL